MSVNSWWPARRLAATVVVLLVGSTILVALDRGAPPWSLALYGAIALLAVANPGAIAVQVVAGSTVVAGLLVGADAPSLFSLLPLVVAVVATAELLGVVARLDAPIERAAGDLLVRAGGRAVGAGAVYAAVVATGRLPGPTGLAAVALGSTAVLVVAVAIGRRGRPARAPRDRMSYTRR